MNNKDFLICLLLSTFVFFAVKFFWKWVNGGFNNIAVREWLNRGFLFGLGFSIALVTVILVFKLIAGN
ncbi:hypothetical protein RFI36_04780 [Acinetobacter gerneri]|uniref:Uncharacterized protein n=1 Tax=Acinetobacter gerneri TaxID=202952 RepID=A0AAW8JFF8_9GAMM|nr:hypothetical protein [Acinetobacter gerneri]MDQ9059228.1 hypothetical protein [Acinetobacter gerneri]MDQ9071103.1 hypothetical protein [Acinetobacter gerneri]MDQ9086779.1 hypothetical protein [Acinetobacter gerneri]